MFRPDNWDVKINGHIVPAIGYDYRGIFGIPVAEKRNGQYISVSIVAIEKGYIVIDENTHYGLTRPNCEEMRVLENLGLLYSGGFVTKKEDRHV